MRIRAAAPRLLDPLDRRLVSRDETGLVDEEATGPDQDPEAVAPQEREADHDERRDALDAVLRPRKKIQQVFFSNRVYEERGGFSSAKYSTFARIEATQSAYGANP